MREIKFRVWEKAKDKYVYTDKGLKLVFPNVLADKHLIFEQFTGLHDKNSREVYEGDIVKYGSDWGNVGTVAYDAKFGYCIEYKIEYRDRIVRTRQEYFADIQSEVEVVGNIHENADLLEGKNEN